MRKLKITSFDEEGVRSGRSLEGVLSEIGHGSLEEEEQVTLEEQRVNEEQTLQICRLSFTTIEKASAMGRLIVSRTWSKIVMEKTSGKFVSRVVQDAVGSTRIFQVKQHQRYDGIKWNFGIDWFPNPSPLQEIHFTGVRFRGGDELKFLKSLAEGLQQSSVSRTGNSIGLRNLELNACRFLHPEIQYPILFKGLRVACFGTLQRLWMPKSPGLDDDRFQELFGDVLGSSDNNCNNSSIVELGFSYNSCEWKGSKAVSSFLESPRSANLQVLYLNRQHGELDLEGILRSVSERTGKLQLNLSQNYVSSLKTLDQLRTASACQNTDSSDEQNPNALSLDVQLDSMSFEVPEAVIPGNGGNGNQTIGSNNKHDMNAKRSNGNSRQKSYEEHLQNLTQDDIAKLNVACGRVKYVLGRAAAACDRRKESGEASVTSSLNHSNNNADSAGSDWFFSSLAALDCVLPDLLTILRLQEKQNDSHSKENENMNIQQHTRQYRNWLPTFLRKAIKGKIEILKPWLLSTSGGQNDIPLSQSNDESVPIEGARPPTVLTDLEQERLEKLWKEIEALHTNIAHHAGQRRHKHATGHSPVGVATTLQKSKPSRKKKHNRKGLAEIPMTPDANPLVKAAYEGIPAIPTCLLESSNGSFLSLPMQSSDSEVSESNHIRTAPPIFIDTVDRLQVLRNELFRKPPPHKIPKMVAIDSEWYFTDNEGERQQSNSGKKRVKHRSLSVATLQIAYVDENESPMVLRSFVIDLLSSQPGFQELAKECVFWLFGSASCDTMVLGFAFGGDLRQLRKYAGITGNSNPTQNGNAVASLEVVASRCLDIQHLLSSPDEIRHGRVPGLKKCAQRFFEKPLKKDDQTSDWRERPLRPSQLEYAALDAVILLVLLSQKKQKDETNAMTPSRIANSY